MAASVQIQQQLLELNWKDFSSYPKQRQSLMVHAEGFDTKERKRKHLFFDIENFDPFNFPDEQMVEKLNEHHVKWTFTWLPQNIKNK